MFAFTERHFIASTVHVVQPDWSCAAAIILAHIQTRSPARTACGFQTIKARHSERKAGTREWTRNLWKLQRMNEMKMRRFKVRSKNWLNAGLVKHNMQTNPALSSIKKTINGKRIRGVNPAGEQKVLPWSQLWSSEWNTEPVREDESGDSEGG